MFTRDTLERAGRSLFQTFAFTFVTLVGQMPFGVLPAVDDLKSVLFYALFAGACAALGSLSQNKTEQHGLVLPVIGRAQDPAPKG